MTAKQIPSKYRKAIAKLKPDEKDLIIYQVISNPHLRAMLEILTALKSA